MRKLILIGTILLGALWAAPAEACEECTMYWAVQTETWCFDCKSYPCGWFNCYVKYYPGLGGEWCSGDDHGCFEKSQGCEQEPHLSGLPMMLENKWRLAKVRVNDSRRTQPSRADSASVVATKG